MSHTKETTQILMKNQSTSCYNSQLIDSAIRMQKPEFNFETDIRDHMQALEKWTAIPRCIKEVDEMIGRQNILGSPFERSRHTRDGTSYHYKDGSVLVDQPSVRDFLFSNKYSDSKEMTLLAHTIFSRQRLPDSWNFIGKGRDAEAPGYVYSFTLNGYTYAAKISTLRAMQLRETTDIYSGLDFDVSRVDRSIMNTIPAMHALRTGGIRTPDFFVISHLLGDDLFPDTICEVQFLEYVPGLTSAEINAYLLTALNISSKFTLDQLPQSENIHSIISDYFDGNLYLFGKAFLESQERLQKRANQIHHHIEDITGPGDNNSILIGINDGDDPFEYAIVDLAIASRSGYHF